METKDKVISVIAKVCEVSPEEIQLTNSIGDFPAWDSIGHLTILSNVEEAFGISFDPDEMMDLEDVNDIIKAVEEKI